MIRLYFDYTKTTVFCFLCSGEICIATLQDIVIDNVINSQVINVPTLGKDLTFS